jgi:hypothetical protein
METFNFIPNCCASKPGINTGNPFFHWKQCVSQLILAENPDDSTHLLDDSILSECILIE